MDTYSEAPNDLVVNGEVITPGALVEASDGPLGRVERVIGARRDPAAAGAIAGAAPGAGAGAARSLLVRTPDGQALDVAVEAVSHVTPNQPAPIVHLRLSRAFLGLAANTATQPQEQIADTEPLTPTAPLTQTTRTAQDAAPEAPANGAISTAAGDATLGDDISVPLVEERLTATTQWAERGRAHIHKRVAYEDQRLVTPLTIEEVIVEHIAPERFDADAPRAEDELVIPVLEERLVVRKETVVREYVRVRKQSSVKQYQVRGQVRREVVQVDETPNPAFGDTNTPIIHEHTVGPADIAP